MSEVVSLAAVPGIPELSRRFVAGDPEVSRFYPDRPDVGTIAARVPAVLAGFAGRAWQDPSSPALADGSTATIQTGQQAGLFTGPLLTLVKALAARQLASELRGRGLPAEAVFWCAAEDHDLVEVSRLPLPSPDGPREHGPEPGPLALNRRPVGELPIDLDVAAILEAAAAEAGSPDPEAVAALRGRAAGPTYRAAFTATLRWLLDDEAFPVLDAARRDVKPRLVPLATRLVRERADVRRLLSERAAALEASGFPLQVTADPAALPLFAIVDGERLLLREVGARLELKGRDDTTFDPEEVVARFESGAWLPSFSALTRPLGTSTLYPVAATILGPAELAYWAQMLPLFVWAGLVSPVLVPRPMVALVPTALLRIQTKLGVSMASVLSGADAVLREKGAGRSAALLEELRGLREAASGGLQALEARLAALDPGLVKPLQTTREKVDFGFEKLGERVAEAAGRADETLARQVARLVDGVRPGGKLAERIYPPLPWVLRYGRERVLDVLGTARWDVAGLQVLEI